MAVNQLNREQIRKYIDEVFMIPEKLDSQLVRHLIQFSQDIGEPVWAVFECCLVDYFASKWTQADYFDMPVTPAPAFQWKVHEDGSKELIRGHDLWNILCESYLWELKRDNEQPDFLEKQKASQEKIQNQQMIQQRFKK
ncbi:hypothetical protein ACFLXY_06755 [Chloroflexota bacterium]